ncbi:hypothetical protein [uncultured Butyricimonas sp.]|uniref:hypothetical protein n=1 Tax=uncultured Butyricimonas sp. TaxID=1268785 RepID=UPI0026DAEEE9|nr:hypothetical protein [uncultured Butyricimonas sp.]
MEFPLILGLQKAGLPLVLTSGKLKNLCFLIDTGSTHNILFDFVHKHFRDEFKILDNTQAIMGIEGHYKETPIIEATFNFEGRDYTSTFSVLEANKAIREVQNETGIQIHGVLGIQFLINNKWIIDFNKLEIYN